MTTENPVAEATTITEIAADGRKIGVTFTRKVSDGNYGGTEVSAYVSNNVPAGADATVVAQALGDILLPAVGAVLDQLGIEYFYDEQTSVLKEKNAPVTVTRVEAAFGASQAGPEGEPTIQIMNPSDSAGALPSWVVSQLNKDGVSKVFDNRNTRDPDKNQPWFKEASKPGQGHGKDGQPKGYWPAK